MLSKHQYIDNKLQQNIIIDNALLFIDYKR